MKSRLLSATSGPPAVRVWRSADESAACEICRHDQTASANIENRRWNGPIWHRLIGNNPERPGYFPRRSRPHRIRRVDTTQGRCPGGAGAISDLSVGNLALCTIAEIVGEPDRTVSFHRVRKALDEVLMVLL